MEDSPVGNEPVENEQDQDESLEIEQVEGDPIEEDNEDAAREALARKAKRFHILGIILLGFAVLQLLMLLTELDTHTARSILDTSISIVFGIFSGVELLRNSRKFAAMSVQEEPLEDISQRPFLMNRFAGGAAIGMIGVIVLHATWPVDIPVLALTTAINLIVALSVFYESEQIIGLNGRIILGCIACAVVFWKSGRDADFALQVVISAYLLFLVSGEPSRKRWKIATFIAAPLISFILVGENRPKYANDSFEAPYASYNKQLHEAARSIDLHEPTSIRAGLYKMQNIMDARAPFLDSMTTKMTTSLALLHPEDTVRGFDTLRFIAWHKVFLENLGYQKREQENVDSLCSLISLQQVTTDSTQRESNNALFTQTFAELVEIDSALSAKSVIEAKLHKEVGKMMMPK